MQTQTKHTGRVGRRGLLGALLMLSVVSFARADATVPVADVSGAQDHPVLKRYEGAFIVSYEQHAYDELTVPLAALKVSDVPDERDADNNRVFRPAKQMSVTGERTRLVYVIPENRSPLEVLHNYRDEVVAAGGEVLFECQAEGCGGDPHRATSGGGGRMSLMQTFLRESSVSDKPFSNGYCALVSRITGQRYMTATLPHADDPVWLTVHTYQLDGSTSCKALNGRTVAVVHVVVPKARDRKMVVVQAEEMARALHSDGSIALYGIFFDTDEARIKPESAPTLQQMADLLTADPQLKVLVVGHTDSRGRTSHNMMLSTRRAEAVKSALSQQYGVAADRLVAAGAGMLAPVATNATEEGRARNRRVALVKLD